MIQLVLDQGQLTVQTDGALDEPRRIVDSINFWGLRRTLFFESLQHAVWHQAFISVPLVDSEMAEVCYMLWSVWPSLKNQFNTLGVQMVNPVTTTWARINYP